MKFRLFLQWMLMAGGLATALSAESVEFTAVSLGDTLSDLEYKSGSKFEALTVPAFSRSELKEYSGSPLLSFYKTVEKDGKPQKVKVAEVTLPEKTSQVLLVFSPQGNGSAKVQALDDTQEAMPRGSSRLYNATPIPVAIKCNEDFWVLAPKEQKKVPGAPPQVVVQMAYEQDGRWVRGGSNVFATGNDLRQTIFIVNSDSELFKAQTPAGLVTLSPLQSFSLPELVKTKPIAP